MKRWNTLVLAAILALTATACSGNSTQQRASEQPSPSVASTSSNEEAVSEQAERDVAPHIAVGVIESSDGLAFALGDPVPVPEFFIGNAYLSMLVPREEVYNMPFMSNVSFEPGARNNWHNHEGGQILMVTGGVGYYQEEGKPAQIIREGDVVLFEPDVKHWHGATPDSWFSHIAISTNPDRPGVEWMEPVADDVYRSLDTEEYIGRADVTDNDTNNEFMFPMGDEMNMETFNGTTHLALVLGQDDIFNCPSILNVIFEPGVINNWHMHEGGQIMIATDGIGFHKLDGQPVEILHPGDVAMCPPGEKHWHGAAPNTRFAHLAISTNPDTAGVEWLEPVAEEEYNEAVEALSE